MQQVAWNRNIISIKDFGRRNLIGIASHNAQKSDIVCIFYGCSVPLVLKPQLDEIFKFVSECYVHSIADREAIDPFPNVRKEVWFMSI